MSADNPLLDRGFPIPFDRIAPEHVVPAATEVLARAEAAADELGAGHGGDGAGGAGAGAGRRDILAELDRIGEDVARTWAPVSHLVNVASTPELRAAHGEALPAVARFGSRLLQHEGVHRRLRDFADSPEGAALTGLRRRHLDLTLRDFRRAGAELGADDKRALEELHVELSELGRRFEENLLDETAAYGRAVGDRAALAGLPDTAMERAAALARARGEKGWLLTLDMPSVQAVLQHADDRSLRREIHAAYHDRCTTGDRDNAPVIERILLLRRRVAAILGYGDFPDYRLETLMAKDGAKVRGFLDDLIDRTRPYHERDAAELEETARRRGLGALKPWDVSYLIEKLRRERFGVDDEQLRPWFPLPEVQSGLFEIARRLFGLHVERVENPAVWHPSVEYFEVRGKAGARGAGANGGTGANGGAGAHLGSFYTDWFPRESKRQGAWMDALISGGPRPDGGFDPHLAFIGGNFNPPTASKPALLTHREVQTLFHEFGHLLHHVCSRVEIPARGGVNVAWDWVEVPSQIMENWCWEREALDLFARHHETGETLPDEALERLLAARRFMGGWMQMRQLSFANLDLELHRTYRGGAGNVDCAGARGADCVDAAAPDREDAGAMRWAAAALRPFVPSASFVERHILPTFAHLFAGGYASAYYSYIWSETLEADAFSRFADAGALDPEVGRAFRDAVLARGDSRDAGELFRDFVGREPDAGALIRRNLGELSE